MRGQNDDSDSGEETILAGLDKIGAHEEVGLGGPSASEAPSHGFVVLRNCLLVCNKGLFRGLPRPVAFWGGAIPTFSSSMECSCSLVGVRLAQARPTKKRAQHAPFSPRDAILSGCAINYRRLHFLFLFFAVHPSANYCPEHDVDQRD